jgi:hypothetical protein
MDQSIQFKFAELYEKLVLSRQLLRFVIYDLLSTLYYILSPIYTILCVIYSMP